MQVHKIIIFSDSLPATSRLALRVHGSSRPEHFACQDLLTAPLSTFLKRKGGLFKKAHELSVLCSVDVAVIIFGHNKKLYEYSSGDINETIERFHYVSAYTLVLISRLTILTVWRRT